LRSFTRQALISLAVNSEKSSKQNRLCDRDLQYFNTLYKGDRIVKKENSQLQETQTELQKLRDRLIAIGLDPDNPNLIYK
ncbi:hypothetical protein VB714_02355, partial [Spirulina sp. 06S082]